LTAGLLRAASEPPSSSSKASHFETHYIKPLQCGGSDESFVLRNAPDVTSTKTLFRWETPASPHIAARMENHPVSDEQVLYALNNHLQSLYTKENASIWIESAGGVLSPSSSSPTNNSQHHARDTTGWGWMTQGDLYKSLGGMASVVLVGDGRLGGISVTLSSLEALLNRKYKVAGILLLRQGDGDYDEDVNQRALQEYVTSVSRTTPSLAHLPLFHDPERSIVSLPKLPPESEPLTDWYSSTEVEACLSAFVHSHLF
jgi:bifunctional dethiobiotin synthetase / adenosylmethionine---8-amino-7-oxononanoate aminotransferase